MTFRRKTDWVSGLQAPHSGAEEFPFLFICTACSGSIETGVDVGDVALFVKDQRGGEALKTGEKVHLVRSFFFPRRPAVDNWPIHAHVPLKSLESFKGRSRIGLSFERDGSDLKTGKLRFEFFQQAGGVHAIGTPSAHQIDDGDTALESVSRPAFDCAVLVDDDSEIQRARGLDPHGI